MGAARTRVGRFLAEHPTCCFCGGTTPAATEDHVPPRIVFTRKHWPETFVFPACQACNRRTSKIEQVVALYANLGAEETDSESEKLFAKLVQGVRNNNPELLPDPQTSANEKRWFLKKIGSAIPLGQTTEDLLLARLPEGVADALAPFFAKLFCAIYYRETGKIFPDSGAISTFFTTPEQATSAGFDELFQLVTGHRSTSRANRDLSSQFSYKFDAGEDGRVFAVLLHLRGRLFVFSGGVTDRDFEIDDQKPKWRDIFDNPLPEREVFVT
jgi:hypothetical protein